MLDPKQAPLAETWHIFVHHDSERDSYESSYFSVGVVSNVYQWLQFKQHLNPTDILCPPRKRFVHNGKVVSTLSLFRDGVLPKWEDPSNMHGNTFSVRGLTIEQSIVFWDTFMMAIAQDEFDETLMGVQVNWKFLQNTTLIRFDLWTSSSTQYTSATLTELLRSPLDFRKMTRT